MASGEVAPRSTPDIFSIRLALKIVEQRSLRRAAAAIGISEAAASQRLRALEEALTVSLFSRSSRGLRPTEAGIEFFSQAREGLRVLDSAISRASVASRGTAGKVTLGVYTSLSAGRLRHAVLAFRKEHPGVEVEVVEAARARLIEGLVVGNVDLILLLGPAEPSLGESLPLWSERIFLISPASCAQGEYSDVDLNTLSGVSFLFSTRGAGPAASALLARAQGFESANFTSHYISREMILSLVGMGFGHSLLLESDIGSLPSDVVARPVAGQSEDTFIPLTAYRDPTNDNPPLRRFWSILKSRYVVPEHSI